jgi:hypothetical protein
MTTATARRPAKADKQTKTATAAAKPAKKAESEPALPSEPAITIAGALPTAGRTPRLDFARALGITPRTLDRWCIDGVDGHILVAEYVGDRKWFAWEVYHAWNETIRQGRQAIEPTPPRKSSAEAQRLAKELGLK